jgi:uncharacterized membrane protein HdeD (DUF308 family)
MTNASNAGAPLRHSLGSGMAALRIHAGWVIAFGIALIVFGMIALASVIAATIATVFYVGVMMLFGAAAEIILAYRAQSWSKFFVWAILGVLYAVAGLLTLSDPLLAATVLTLLLGAALVATGAVRVYLGFHMRDGGPWLWVVASGAITAILGIVILLQWPISSLYTLGIFLGVDLVVAGASWLSIGMALKSHSANL